MFDSEVKKQLICFNLNGTPISEELDPKMRLVDLLREKFKLMGTKEGCGIGECGACTVLLDDKPVNSCLVLAGQIAGKNILTIEGLNGMQEGLHPVQEAFIVKNAIQCGYCTPGMVMSVYALLKKNENPTELEITEAISGNLCRCTGYKSIVEATKLAAQLINKKRQEKERA